MTDDSLQRVIDDVFDEYAEIMNSFLFPFEHCKDCGCHFTQPHDMACIGASILASIPRRCANLKHRLAALSAQTEARPIDEYHEDMGPVTWWSFPIREAAWIGTPNDSDWPEYHTHFTPHPVMPSNHEEIAQGDL